MQLVLIVATAGTDITSIINRSGGASHTPSIDWSLHRHAVTLMKPGGGITHQTTFVLLVGKGGSYWVVDTPGSSVWGCQTSPPPSSNYGAFSLGLLIREKSLQWQLQVWRGVALSPSQGTCLGASSLQGAPWSSHGSFPSGGASWWWLGALGTDLLRWDDGGFLWKSYALEHNLVGEGEVALCLFLKLYHAPCQKVWFTSSWQWCRWGLMVVLHPALFTHPLQELKRGPYLTCQLFIVI